MRPVHIWVDADACPAVIKDILDRAAERTRTPLTLVANKALRTPRSPYIRAAQVARGIDVADSHIVRSIAPGDLVVTADIPLAARCLAKDARVLGPKGRVFTDNDIGSALALRELKDGLRQGGTLTGGPAPMTPKDRSRFLSKLDEVVNAVRRAYPPR